MKIINKSTRQIVINQTSYVIKLFTYLISLFIYCIYLLLINNMNYYSINEIWVLLLSWVGVGTLIYVFYSWYKATSQLFTPYTIFMLFFFLFNFGQPLMWAFGIHLPNEIGVSPIYPGHPIATISDIVKTQSLILISAWMLHSGALISISNKQNNQIKYYKTSSTELNNNKEQMLKIIFVVSLLFAIPSVPITLWTTYEDLKIAMTYGYRALYYSEYARMGASIEGFFNFWFFPSLIGLLIGSKYNKKISFIVYIIMAIFVLLNVFAGDRHPWIYKIFILIWLGHVVNKPLLKRKVIAYLFIAIVSVYILDTVVSLRNSGITIAKVIESLSLNNSSVLKAIFEMGTSMNTTLYLQNYGEDFWQHGNTYLTALIGLVSNRILDYFSIEYGVLSRYLSEYLGINYGPGFSIVAEALINYGQMFAPLFMIVLGIIIGKLFYVNKFDLKYNNPLKLIFVASSLDVLTRINRDSVHIPLKEWFYGVVFFCLIIYLLREFLFTKKVK